MRELKEIIEAAIDSMGIRTDTRNDLGYGRTTPKFHTIKSAGSDFPYPEEDPYDDIDWEDEESENSVASKTLNIQKIDPLSIKGTTPFYFAAGNTKLSDCFIRPDAILHEIEAVGKAMTPIPRLYSKKTNVGSGSGFRMSSNAISTQNFRRTGTKRGYFGAPPPLKNNEPNDNLENFFLTLKSLADKISVENGNFKQGS